MLTRFRQAKADVATMRRVYAEADQVARGDGRTEPDPGDLVVAALGLPDAIARDSLTDAGVEPLALRAALADLRSRPAPPTADSTADPTAPDPAPDPAPAEPSMKMTFHHAVANAKARKATVTSGDILLAATQSDAASVCRALAALGVDAAPVRDAVRARTPE